jgi:tetrahydromethanopterin S-methyltransferase subunit B
MPDNGPWITKTIIELEERIAELECMVKVFRGCIDTRVLPSKGSPCHKIVWELVGSFENDGEKE